MRSRLARTIGLICVLAGMLRYHSAQSQAVLGRWSVPFAAALVLVAVAAVASAMAGRRQREPATSAVAARRALFDLGMLVGGVAYLLAALDDAVQGGRLLDLNAFGSVAPLPAALEWVSMLLLAGALIAWLVSHAGRRWANALLAFGSVLATLLVAEGAARAWTLGTAATHFGNASKVWQRRFVQRNGEGHRDVEHDTARGPRRRLLVVGDSYAFGWGVERIADRFGEQLAGRLTASGAGEWEAINISEPDKHLLQEFAFLREGLAYHPDLVVHVYVFNDLDYLAGVTPRPMLAEAPRGLQRLHPMRIAFTNSYLFQELYARYLADVQRRAARQRSPFAAYDDSALLARHLDDFARYVAIAERKGIPVVIAPLDPATGADTAALRRYDRFVAAVRGRGLRVVSLAHAFDGVPIRRYTVSSLDGHPNALGHRLAAAAAAPQVLGVLAAVQRERDSVTLAGAPASTARGPSARGGPSR